MLNKDKQDHHHPCSNPPKTAPNRAASNMPAIFMRPDTATSGKAHSWQSFLGAQLHEDGLRVERKCIILVEACIYIYMNCCGWPFRAHVSPVESIVLILGRPQISKFKPLIKHLFAQFPQGFQARRFQCFKSSGWLHKNTGHQRDFQHATSSNPRRHYLCCKNRTRIIQTTSRLDRFPSKPMICSHISLPQGHAKHIKPSSLPSMNLLCPNESKEHLGPRRLRPLQRTSQDMSRCKSQVAKQSRNCWLLAV